MSGGQDPAAMQTDHKEKDTDVASGISSRHRLLNGYHVDHRDHDTVMTFDLKDGKRWKKRIYPRVSYRQRLLRWGTVEEILSYLISFDSHKDWILSHVPQQPPSGTIMFFDRSKTKQYRNDGYDWKMRKSLSTIVREDRMKLKVGGFQLLYGCYAHSSSNPNLHRRTYWLIHNPNVIMVHYLEVVSTNLYDIATNPPIQGQGNLDLSDTPSDWSMLTVSDCNLCALLDMISTDVTRECLFSQLSLILNNNLEQAKSLEEAIESNNAGLPVDMFQDSRTKKTWSNVTKTEKPVVNPQPPRPIASNDSVEKVQPLYESPHLVVCRTQNGTMSCFVTIPPPSKSPGATMFAPGTKLPLPSVSQSAVFSKQLSGETKEQTCKLSKKRRGRKGKEKATDFHENENHGKTVGNIGRSVRDIFSQMLSFIKPSDSSQQTENASNSPVVTAKPSDTTQPIAILSDTAQMTAQQPANGAQSSNQTPTSNISTLPNQGKKKDDYDPDRFTQFAHVLAGIDHTKNIDSVEKEPSSVATSRCSSSSSFSSMASSSTSFEEVRMDSMSKATSGEPTSSMPTYVDSNMDVSGALEQNFMTIRDEEILASNGSEEMNLLEFSSIKGRSQLPLPYSTVQYTEDSTQPPLALQNNSKQFDSQADLQNMSMENDSFLGMSLDLDSGSVQHLLQFSQEPHADSVQTEAMHTDTHSDSVDPPLSPLTQLMNSLTSPDSAQPTQMTNTQAGIASKTSDSVYSRNLDLIQPWTHVPVPDAMTEGVSASPILLNDFSRTHDHSGFVNQYQSQTISSNPLHAQAVSSNPLQPQAIVSIASQHQPMSANINHLLYNSSLENQTQITSNANTFPRELHDLLSQTDPHLPIMTTSDVSPQTSDSVPLDPHSMRNPSSYSQAVPNNSLDQFMAFPRPMLPTQQYQDLESLVNTFMNNEGTGSVGDTNQVLSDDQRISVTSTSYDSSDLNDGVNILDARSTCSSSTSLDNPSAQTHIGQIPIMPYRQTHNLSLPNLKVSDADLQSPSYTGSTSSYNTTDSYQILGRESPLALIGGGSLSSPTCRGSASPMALQDIPEGSQIELEDVQPIQQLDMFEYRANAPSIPSSPSQASISSRSSVSVHDLFEGGSPSVLELCELLSESPNVQQYDFSHLTLTDSEQQQLFRAARTIQHAFRKYKDRRQIRCRQKRAALMIEKYYKEYKDMKRQQDHAARRIQQQYRDYKRIRELNRAVVFIQQMYRYHKRRALEQTKL